MVNIERCYLSLKDNYVIFLSHLRWVTILTNNFRGFKIIHSKFIYLNIVTNIIKMRIQFILPITIKEITHV